MKEWKSYINFILQIYNFWQCWDSNPRLLREWSINPSPTRLRCGWLHRLHEINSISTTQLIHTNIWLLSNIKMNTNESNFILYSYRNNILIPTIKMGDNFISQTYRSRFLGVIYDEHLNFGEHINNISSKISKSVCVLYRLNSL